MNEKRQTLNHAMTYALIMGVTFSLNFYLGTLATPLAAILQMLLTCTIPILLYTFARNCRDTICDGNFTYRQGLSYGLQLFFYASLISSLFKYIYFKWINPDYLYNLHNQTMEIMNTLKIPITEQIEDTIHLICQPLNMIAQYIWLDILLGLFLSLIIAAIVRRSAPCENN